MPAFVTLAAHPIRWQLLRQLTHSDRAVRELAELLGERQNLVSYHLARLREAGLVRARRSSADARDTYYAIDLRRCEQALRQAGDALHPGLLGQRAGAPVGVGRGRRGARRRLLFVCTGNSARSQMAEALARHLSSGAVAAWSAGSEPKAVHPLAVQVMRSRGIDISAQRAKHLHDVASRRFDVAITLCDRVREHCPTLAPVTSHWSIADPSAVDTRGRRAAAAFEHTASELEERLRYLLPALA